MNTSKRTSKTIEAFTLIEIIIVLAIIGLLCALLVPQAQAQVTPKTLINPTGLPASITAGANSNNLTAPIILHKGQGLGFAWTYNGSTNVSATITASPDGTNYFAFCTLTQTNAGAAVSGTNMAVLGTNWSAAQLAGLYSLNISAMANTGSIATTNGATPVVVNRPN